ncbi:Fanconi anaemia protein FancD2 nuclease-domain-containing protein [Gongronella butleri]|nr:Fanconi anaemia protein FancD2 nuclease-domain-containing protein [Gongronella butleri]
MHPGTRHKKRVLPVHAPHPVSFCFFLFFFLRAASVDSLFRCLLSIDILQPALISTLLERLPEFYDELEQDQSSSCTARLILHQLRWLDHIVNPQKLTSTLIEQMVTFLKEWMDEHKELTVPILDTLSNLTLHSESLEDVRQKVMEGLPAAEVDDLAVMIKFLLQTVTQSTVDLTIVDLRQNMDFRTLVRLQNAATRRNQGTQQGTAPQQYPEALILESIKLGLQFHRFVSTAWIKALVALETERAHKVMDMMVIFILHSMASMKKKAEQILRKKIIARLITSKLIKETLTNHAHGLASYWGSIIALAESLLRSSHQHGFLASCAQALYTHAFKSSDAYYRQEIIGSLVTHVGSGVKEEMDVALQVLLVLAQELPSTLATYSVFLKGILDYLDNLSLAQIRMLFDVFNLLAIKVKMPGT